MPHPITIAQLSTDASGRVLLSIAASHPAVLATKSFVSWVVQAGEASVPVHLAKLIFLPRCDLSGDPEHLTFFNGIHSLNFNITAAAWTRIIEVLVAGGVFAVQGLSRAKYTIAPNGTSWSLQRLC